MNAFKFRAAAESRVFCYKRTSTKSATDQLRAHHLRAYQLRAAQLLPTATPIPTIVSTTHQNTTSRTTPGFNHAMASDFDLDLFVHSHPLPLLSDEDCETPQEMRVNLQSLCPRSNHGRGPTGRWCEGN